MDQLPIIGPYVNLGGWLAVIVLVLVSAIRGWLVPGTQLQRLIDAYERVIEDKDRQIDNWRVAFNNSDSRGDILAANQRDLTDSIKTTNQMLQALTTTYRAYDQKEPTK